MQSCCFFLLALQFVADYEADVVKTRMRKQNCELRKVSIKRFNKNAAYEQELLREAQRLTSNRSVVSSILIFFFLWVLSHVVITFS